MTTLPLMDETYSIPATFHGVNHDDYWRVLYVSGDQRRSVYLMRHGTEHTTQRIGLREFQRKARVSPR